MLLQQKNMCDSFSNLLAEKTDAAVWQEAEQDNCVQV